MPETPPILLLVHRRADLVARILGALRQVRPRRLFVAADGPRDSVPEDVATCCACRQVVTESVDWPCRVETLHHEKNLGIHRSIPAAISWFFEHVEEGLILEEDILPDQPFFSFCGELLARYREEPRVWLVAGSNQYGNTGFGEDSYAFTLHPPIWGFATWRRAWIHHQPEPGTLQESAIQERLEHLWGSPEIALHWSKLIRQSASGQIQSWAYPWRWTLWKHGALAAVPRVNLVSNIGYDARGLHSTDPTDPNANRRTENLEFPLRHPAVVADNHKVTRHRLAQSYRKHRAQPWMQPIRKPHRATRLLSRLLHLVSPFRRINAD